MKLNPLVGPIWSPGWAAAIADRPIKVGQKIVTQKGLPAAAPKRKKNKR